MGYSRLGYFRVGVGAGTLQALARRQRKGQRDQRSYQQFHADGSSKLVFVRCGVRSGHGSDFGDGMKLTELNPRWLGCGGEGITDMEGNPVQFREKVAITFDCPCGDSDCMRACISFTNPPDGKGPSRSREESTWAMAGNSFENLTLAPSIQRVGECGWHGWIKEGNVTEA